MIIASLFLQVDLSLKTRPSRYCFAFRSISRVRDGLWFWIMSQSRDWYILTMRAFVLDKHQDRYHLRVCSPFQTTGIEKNQTSGLRFEVWGFVVLRFWDKIDIFYACGLNLRIPFHSIDKGERQTVIKLWLMTISGLNDKVSCNTTSQTSQTRR